MYRYLLIVTAIVLTLSLFGLDSVTLFDVDEAVFSEATKEMVESGDWITPTYNGVNRYDKPILFYWMMAGSYKIFGINEFGARFPSAFSAIILALSVFFFTRRFYDQKSAFYTVLSLVLTLYFLFYSHAAVTDMSLTLFITLSLFSFYLSIEEGRRSTDPSRQGSRKRNMYTYGFYAFSSLAFLTKGLIGIVFPFGIAIMYLIVTEGPKNFLRVHFIKMVPKGLIVFLIISGPWYGTQLITNGNEFIQQFIIKHHFKRYTGVISGHRGPVYYFIPVLTAGIFPWIVFLPAGIRNALMGKKPLVLFSLIWFLFIFIFFSFSTTKLPNYILPAIPPLAIMIGTGIGEEGRIWRMLSRVLLAGISLALSVGFLISRRFLVDLDIDNTGWVFCLAGLMMLMALVGIIPDRFLDVNTFRSLILRKNTGKVNGFNLRFSLLAIIMFLFLMVVSLRVLPVVNSSLQGALYRYSLYAKDRLKDEGKLITYRINNPSVVFYSGHRILKADNIQQLISQKEAGSDLLIISKAEEIPLLEGLGFSLIESEGGYAILERE
jgi:4-amino-4-deoxy-L-arabinose transferase-like glycosyltransferase